ncbi:L-histidine N(alpha)-methyltransferase [Hansschlegelia sp. KR7-227]|uniref:L-histidine N(alpha)-methyltransferase n=1 Tax=Hansschlegelia sp. KR7-227 TaxID=3400914 RepID=UPI003C05249A
MDEEPNLAAFSFGESVAHGMTLEPKRIGSKWLYDAEGSRLFDEIVASPRYYLPRAETEILQARASGTARLKLFSSSTLF